VEHSADIGYAPGMFVLLLLAACNNACQQICDELAAYAEDDCGLTVSQDQVSECKKSQADLEAGQNEACMEVADPEYIREWWTCDELAENFQDGAK
jgi:hypothetical protein